jgi:hypothetical protein
MPLEKVLLAQAQAAERRLIDVERDMEVARAEFHNAVRRLQLAGGSLREIAEALGMSHQRVHQIVDNAGGARGWRTIPARNEARKQARTEPTCSFCGKRKREVPKLIAGPKIYICSECVALATRVLSATEKSPRFHPIPADAATAKCRFCGKRRHQAEGLAAASSGAICTECLDLCREIIDEALA